jgi:transposase InsO family protein
LDAGRVPPASGPHISRRVLIEEQVGQGAATQARRESTAFTVFERACKDFGLPGAIRNDNGVPFACSHALFGLSRLSVWWPRLGIDLERIQPGHPQQNGRHERMHLTLKKEATRHAARNLLRQQALR